MLSILVGHSYFLRFDRKQWERAKPYPPLATLQTAALLRDAGHSVAVFDAMLADGPDQFARQLQEVAPQVVVLYEDNFNFLSKMCLEKMRSAACRMISASRRRGARVLVAGSDATDTPQVYLGAGAEVVLLGEGLTALSTVCARLALQPGAATSDLVEGVPEVAYMKDGSVLRPRTANVRTGAPHPGMPALDLVDVDKYRDVWRQHHGYFSLNMSASRGCSFRCNWCAKPIWGNQYLQRPALEVAAEMAYLKRHFAPDHVWFADDIFGFRVDWVERFAAAIAADDCGIPFTIQIRPDLISPRMARALRSAGCSEAWLGAESGSQRVLDDMDKGTTVAEIITARERLRNDGIRVGFFIQLGYLGERIEDILATRRLVATAKPDDVGVSVSYPLPGTKFYERVKAQLGAKTHWQESDDLTMMFEGTYSTEFYRLVRDLLHAQVDTEQPAVSSDPVAHRAAKGKIEERWGELIATERSYRLDSSGPSPAAAKPGHSLAAGIA
jgi:anaerobic magnesium-protoporphyrin IX monomethyl ester cyclase